MTAVARACGMVHGSSPHARAIVITEEPGDGMTYTSVHNRLYRERGRARDFKCSCGNQALDWALQHTGEVLFDEGIQRWYSNCIDDYAPMCRPCHVRLDVAKQEHVRARVELIATLSARGVSARSATPEIAARVSAAQSAGAKAGGGGVLKRLCIDCGMTSSAGPLGGHQKRTGHTRWENIG